MEFEQLEWVYYTKGMQTTKENNAGGQKQESKVWPV